VNRDKAGIEPPAGGDVHKYAQYADKISIGWELMLPEK